MSRFRIRPRFSQTVDLDLDVIQAQIVSHVDREANLVEVKNFPGYVTLRIPEKDQHFWSPLLNLSLESTSEGKTVIHGIYGPNTNVWTIFLYGYLLTGSLAMFAGLFGLAQWIVGVNAWGLIAFGILLALIFGLYFLALSGRKIAEGQTFLLHTTYEAAIGRTVELR